MTPRLLVASSIHPPDDPRIREKLIRTLAGDFDIAYATQTPGPSDPVGLEWIELAGTRGERRRQVRRLLRDDPYDVAVIHDPELLPGAIAATRRGRTVVFDLHEDVPAQIRTKASVPSALRSPVSAAAARYLRRAEGIVEITLAEDGYQSLFRSHQPVFENYPVYDDMPVPGRDPDGPIVYVGDVTEIRGARTLVEAAGRASVGRVEFIGRCAPTLADSLRSLAERLGVDIEFRGWLPHAEAMEAVTRSSVGVAPLHDVPNYRRSLPTKTLEYLALGVPVVASDLPGTRRVIGELPGVQLVPPSDARALADALDRVAHDPGIASAAMEGSSRVRTAYRWPADEVRAFYTSLVA